MDSLFSIDRLPSLDDPLWQSVFAGAMQALMGFALVAARLAGMAFAGPLFGTPAITMRIRVALIAAMTFVVAPALLSMESQAAFSRLDRNRDHRLTVAEVAPPLRPVLLRQLAEAGKPETDSLAPQEFRSPPIATGGIGALAWLAVTEFAMGFALGFGVMVIFSALQMAGALIDQQLGLSMGEMFNPQLGIEVGFSGQMLHQLGLVLFLTAGGHLLLVSALLETFRTLPVGYAWIGPPAFELLPDLVAQSLKLAIRAAAPVLASMAAVGLAVGFLGRTLPYLNASAVGLPVRIVTGVLVLGLSLAGIADLMNDALPDAIVQIRNALTGFSGGSGTR